ncbi:CocE/NonD family hydrolase [Nocardia heshunensis]
MGRLLRLPPAVTRDVKVTKGIRIPMPDGIELVADLYEPNVPDAPTVLSRTPYARVGMLGRGTAMPLAERGFTVLIQSCRGTHGGSGGVFEPLVNEEKDGLATLDWIEQQPWFTGKLFLFGASYVGHTQLTLAVAAGDRVAGLLPTVTTASFSEVFFPGGAIFTGLILQWIRRMTLLERSAFLADFVETVGDRVAQRGMWNLPLTTSDIVNCGKRIGFYQDWLRVHDTDDGGYWLDHRDYRHRLADITAPTHHVTGWQDLALVGQLRDYEVMRAAGRAPLLTVGPWHHVDTNMLAGAHAEALDWFRALADDSGAVRKHPVKLYIQGADEWRGYDAFPPRGMAEQRWFARTDGGFATVDLDGGEPHRFRYDPVDPTPGIGGGGLDPKQSGRRDQAARERRSDVLVYTSAPLEQPFEIIGPVTAGITLRTSAPHADVFVTLCDVDQNGVSTNVCDGIQRTTPASHPAAADGTRTVAITLWPTAFRFKPGHRLRLQISGGAFPRFARNTGSGDPAATATRLVPVDFEILPGSSILLPAMPS